MQQLEQWGIDKIVAPQYFFRPNGTGSFVRKMSDMAARNGIEILAAHGLLGVQHDLGCAGEKEIKEHILFMGELAEVGVKTYTVHAGTHHKMFDNGQNIPWDFWDKIRHSLDVLLPAAERLGITIACENIYEPKQTLLKLLALLGEIRHPCLGLCLDVGHANISEAGLDWVFEQMKDRIVTCHLHDNDGITDLHAAPGTGNIDFVSLVSKLKQLPSLIHAETETRTFSKQIQEDFMRLLM